MASNVGVGWARVSCKCSGRFTWQQGDTTGPVAGQGQGQGCELGPKISGSCGSRVLKFGCCSGASRTTFIGNIGSDQVRLDDVLKSQTPSRTDLKRLQFG